jgi:hypothetical protein
VAAEEGEPGRAVAADPEPEAPARRLSRAGQGPQEGHRQGQNQPFPVFRILIYRTIMISSVSDPYLFYSDPDLGF